jgi:hypothetical protein
MARRAQRAGREQSKGRPSSIDGRAEIRCQMSEGADDTEAVAAVDSEQEGINESIENSTPI